MDWKSFAVIVVRDKYDRPQNVITANEKMLCSKPSNWEIVETFPSEAQAAAVSMEVYQTLLG